MDERAEGTGVFTFPYFFWEKPRVLFVFFFQMSLAIRGTIFFFLYQQAKNGAPLSKIDPKINTYFCIDISVLSISGIKKVVCWTFWKFFLSCLNSVYALF